MSLFRFRKNTAMPYGNSDHIGNQVIQRRQTFSNVVRSVDSILAGVSGPTERAAIYDYAIWALGRQIAADGNGAFVCGESPLENRDYATDYLFPKTDGSSVGEQIFDLAQIPAYTGPWDQNRFPKGILSVFSQGYRQELARNKGIYYKELNFAVMLEGRHHTSWGVFSGECLQTLDVVTLEPYFPVVKTDGACFSFPDEDMGVAKRKATDYRFAVMYHLAQRRWQEGIPSGISHSTVEYRYRGEEAAQQQIQDAHEGNLEHEFLNLVKAHSALRNKLYISEQDNAILKQQCSAKDQRIQELERQLSSSK